MMKRLLCALLLAAGLVPAAFSQHLGGSVVYLASSRGARTSATLNSLITAIGGNMATIALDGGVWTITANVTFPTNITVFIPQGSRFQIDTGINVAIRGDFVAGHYRVFTGTGTATGPARFTHRIPEWGSTNQFDIGQGDLVGTNNLTYYVSLLVPTAANAVTNIIDGGTSGSAGTITMGTNNATITFPSATVRSLLNGCWPRWYSSTQIYVEPGEGYCSGNYFCITQAILHSFTELNVDKKVQYVYLSHAGTTYPYGVSVVDSSNAPSYNVLNAGWYHGNNRLLGAVQSRGPAIGVTKFVCSADGYVGATGIVWYTKYNPDGSWFSPYTNSSTLLPVSATMGFSVASWYDSGGNSSGFAMSPHELADTKSHYTGVSGAYYKNSASWNALDSTAVQSIGAYASGDHYPGGFFVVLLGPSLTMDICGSSSLERSDGYIVGWKMNR
jgi:hypothetical protein